MASDNRRKRVVNLLVERLKTRPQMIADQYGQAADAKPLSPERERQLFWQKDPNVDPQQLYMAAAAAAAQMGMDPAEALQHAGPNVMKALYPFRDDQYVLDPHTGEQKLVRRGVVTLGTRALKPDEMKAFVDRMVAMGPPEGDTPNG